MSANDTQVGGDHYKKGGDCQHWDFITANFGPGYLIGCATKYVIRWRDKNGIEDLKKAMHYCQKLAEGCEEFGWRPGEYHFDQIELADLLNANNVELGEARIIAQIVEWKTEVDFRTAQDMIASLIEGELRDRSE